MARQSKNPTTPRSAEPKESPEDLRSRTMRAVKSKDTGPELIVRRFLHSAGLRYALHVRLLPGAPDLSFPARRAVVFVHGCFWHQHPGCGAASRPKSKLEYWTKKLDRNVERDRKHRVDLEAAGWKVLTIWECEVRDKAKLQQLASQLLQLKKR